MLLALLLMVLSPIHCEELSEDDSRKFDYFFMEACRLKMKGEYQASAEMFQNCIQIDNKSAVSHFELGKILLLGGDQQNGIILLRQSVLLSPSNDWYQLYLTNVFVRANQLHQAIDVYHNLYVNNPTKVDYMFSLGELYAKTNQYEKAIAVYNDMEKLEGVSEGLILEKQRLYLLANDEKNALKETKRLVDEYPSQSRYLILLGDFYVTSGNYKKAQKIYDQVQEMDPESGFLHMSLASFYEQKGDDASSQRELYLAFESLDITYEHKMQILLSIMMLSEEDPRAKVPAEELTAILKRVYPEEASIYFFYGSYIVTDTARVEEATDNLQKSVELDPSNVEAWMQLIQIAFSTQDFEQVLEYTEGAILGGTKTSLIYFYRGIAFQQIGEDEKAKWVYLQANAVTKPQEAIKIQILGSLGDVSYSLGERDSAFSYYKQSLLFDSHNAMVLNNFAYFLSEADSALAEAETMSAKCIELEPGNATYLDTYAWILYLRDNYLLAKFYMEKAINLSPEENDVLYDHFGDILWANDDKEQARSYWLKAINTGGDAEKLTMKIEQE